MIDRPTAQVPKENLEDMAELLRSTPFGRTIEIGVYQGGSAIALFEADPKRPLHLFDTFKGIPEQTLEFDAIPPGTFKEVDLEKVYALLPEATFHVGVFPSTLPDDLTDISFVHVDCDQYATCKAAIEKLWPRMNVGGVMAFDDYPFKGIKKAIHDVFESELEFTKNNVPYVRRKHE